MFAQTKLYIHPNAKEYVSNTKSIAILPLDVQVKLRPKELKDFTQEQIVEMNKSESKDIQRAMYSWFLTRKKRGSLLIEKVQSPNVTNAKLKKAGINIHSYSHLTPSELGKILDVDVIITGTYESSKPMSNAAGAALMLLGGIAGATSHATINMDFLDTRDDELIVNYFKKVKGSLGSTSDDLVNVLMRKASRRIPYTK
jgi:hypothetical protein